MNAKTSVGATVSGHTPKLTTARGESVGRNEGDQTQVSATAKIGYARISTSDGRQTLDRQMTELADCDRIFFDEASGAKVDRPGLVAALDYLRAGDALHVVALDRLGRNTEQLLALLRLLDSTGCSLVVRGMSLDTSTPLGQFTLVLLSGLAEMERAVTRERVMSGLAESRRQGRVGGRPESLTLAQKELARRLISEGEPFRKVAAMLGTSTRTVQRAVRS